jgi:hypothetical protein
MLQHALLSHVSKAARNAQGVDAVAEEVQGRAKRRMAEEIFCHDHETTRQRNNESEGKCTLEKRGEGKDEVILRIHTVFVLSVGL